MTDARALTRPRWCIVVTDTAGPESRVPDTRTRNGRRFNIAVSASCANGTSE
jgi:hypothetical protein